MLLLSGFINFLATHVCCATCANSNVSSTYLLEKQWRYYKYYSKCNVITLVSLSVRLLSNDSFCMHYCCSTRTVPVLRYYYTKYC